MDRGDALYCCQNREAPLPEGHAPDLIRSHVYRIVLVLGIPGSSGPALHDQQNERCDGFIRSSTRNPSTPLIT